MVSAPRQVMFSLSNVSPVWFLMCFQAPQRPRGALILPEVKRRGSPSLPPLPWGSRSGRAWGPQRLPLQHMQTPLLSQSSLERARIRVRR